MSIAPIGTTPFYPSYASQANKTDNIAANNLGKGIATGQIDRGAQKDVSSAYTVGDSVYNSLIPAGGLLV